MPRSPERSHAAWAWLVAAVGCAGCSGARGTTPSPPPPGPYVETWPVIVEAENFTTSPKGAFNISLWGEDHLYGATFSNTFASRKALLHATKDSIGTATSAAVPIPRAGTWYVCVRYEAAYRYETEFKLSVSQGGPKLTKLYGQRASPKIWPFGWSLTNHEIAGCGANPTPECHWTWGGTENWVYEYYPVSLSAGPATFEITVSNETSSGTMAMLTDRNIDAILLTQNLTNMQHRMENEQQLALDGLFSQHDEVFARVHNTGTSDLQLEVPFAAYHSAYPSQHMICVPYCTSKYGGPNPPVVIPGLKGTTSAWTEMGSRLDAFNDGTLTVTAVPYKPPPFQRPVPTPNTTMCRGTACALGKTPSPPPPPPPFDPRFTVEFGVKASGGVTSIGSFMSTPGNPNIEVLYDANTVATRRVRVADAALAEAIAEAKEGPVPPGSKGSVQHFPVFGYTFCTASSIRSIEPSCYLDTSVSPNYKANLAEFLSMIPISDTSSGDPSQQTFGLDRGQGYLEARSLYHNLTTLTAALQKYVSAGIADKVMVVSMGDEISLADPWDAQAAFPKWCQASGIPPSSCSHYNATDATKPTSFWYSNLFKNAYGLSVLAPATKVISQMLKNAGVGANYSPLTYTAGGYVSPAYWYPVNKAVTMYRTGSMTLPWGEDYTWQSPVGTQQMTTILHDMFRAGIRNAKTATTSQMMFYTMAHAPGTTATNWRRNFYNYLAHGMTRLNVYEMRPCTASYTENYVDVGWGIYGAVRTALAELATFEDIMVAGTRIAPGGVGMWNSDAGDIWTVVTPPATYGQHQSTTSAAKRALYIALLHAEFPLDMVVEDDIGSTLDSYTTIFLADSHVTKKASAALAAWVTAGGTLVATAGGGMWDEFNASNTVLQKLFGVASPTATREPKSSAVQYIKQDLRFASVLAHASFNGTASGEPSVLPAIGFTTQFKVAAGSPAKVIATFDDGAPAATRSTVGSGAAYFMGFLPGFSYFLPALLARPADRGGTDAAYTHFVPTNFSTSALGVLVAMAGNVTKHINCSDPLVHGRLVVSSKGVVIPLTLWRPPETVLTDLNVTVQHPTVKHGMKASLASGGAVAEVTGGPPGTVTFTLVGNFTVADALVLRG